MRLLYVTHSLPLPGRPESNVGGMQRLASGLRGALAAHPRVRLHELVLETAWEDTHRRMPGFLLRLLRELPRTVEREGIEAVLFTSTVTASVLTLAGGRVRRAGAVSSLIPNGLDVTLPSAPVQWLVRRFLPRFDVLFPLSRATAAECAARGVDPGRMRIVPPGIDPAEFTPPGDRGAAQAEMLAGLGLAGKVEDGALLLCSVGRHQERKGFAWFADAVMPRLPADVHFLLAGEGPTTPAIREAAARRGLGGRVHLLGRVSEDDLRRLYRGADLFVMPNVPVPGDMEGFGIVQTEAGLSGMPVLGSALEGILDVVEEGENGHLLPSGDADAFVAAVLRYRDDRDALAALSARSVRSVASRFAWTAVAERYVSALEEVAARRAGPG